MAVEGSRALCYQPSQDEGGIDRWGKKSRWKSRADLLVARRGGTGTTQTSDEHRRGFRAVAATQRQSPAARRRIHSERHNLEEALRAAREAFKS